MLFIFCFVFSPAFAFERIKIFHSNIYVRKDGSVTVTEKITVNREGKEIKRGIYRDLPKMKGVTYTVLSVKRDGQSEPYFTENAGRFYRINTGNDDYLPRNGLYTFEIKYRASNVILGFKDYDEIYWNVTGNEWNFPIERASAKVFLPNGAIVHQSSSYIGKKGSKLSGNYDFQKNIFFSPAPLSRGEGLTVAVGFDKGFVNLTRTAPVSLKQYAYYAAMILVAYMLITWFLFGRDPAEDIIVPRFRGLTGLSPSLAGWIYSYGHNKEGCLAAALLQGGLSGFLKIKYNDGLLKVTKTREAKNGEEKMFEHYLTFPLVVVDQYSAKLERFMMDFSDFLERKAGEKYFISNTLWVFLGGVLALTLAAGLCLLAETIDLTPLMGFYLIFLLPVGKRFLKAIVIKRMPYTSFLTIILISLHFSSSAYNALVEHPEALIALYFYFLSIIALIIYSYLIIRPTYEGMRIIAHLDGIKMFLKAVGPTLPKEADINKMEALLPYALMLGLEKEWETKMKLVLHGQAYLPDWFNGRFSANCFSSLNTTLSKAGTPPVRSGSKGGGFSGGGFGGGGGGGR
ncbi:MAG: DUF2207 domain-containing protein [Alphaproteobacteria bacterium]|nr:DUF2207 domain-containing protein [Alphaproteobacteria bacterium]